MRISIDSDGLEEVQDAFNDALAASEVSMERFGNFVGRSTQQRVKNKIRNSPASGRVYVRQNPERVVQASAPGEPPANDLGNLADSYQLQLYSTASKLAYVFSDLFYAIELELGTGQIAPRPHLLPSFLEAIEEAQGRLKKEFEAANK